MFTFRVAVSLLTLAFVTSYLAGQESRFPKPEPTGPQDYVESPIKPEIGGFVGLTDGGQSSGRILVKLETATGTMLAQTWTGNSGEFSFPEIACGDYVLAVDAPGYKPVRERIEHSYIPAGAIFLRLAPVERAVAGTGETAKQIAPRVPKQAQKEYERGLRALLQKKTDESIVHFRKATALCPQCDVSYNQLALAEIQKQAFPEALKTLEEALQHNPKNAEAHALLGRVLKQQGRLSEAVGEFESSLLLRETSWSVHLELGEILMSLLHANEAYPHILRAHYLNPDLPATHLQLYNVFILLNDFAAAETELSEFLKLFPKHPQAARVQQQRDTLLARLQAASN